MPSLRVDHMHPVRLPDKQYRVFARMEAWSQLESRDAEGRLAACPWPLADLLGFAVDEAQLPRVVLESNEAHVVAEQMVDDFTGQVGLLGQLHRKVALVDEQDGDAVVCAEHEAVVGLVLVDRQHHHRVDHAKLVEEAARGGFGLLLHLQQVELAGVLGHKHVLVRLACFTDGELGSEDNHLRDFLRDASAVTGLEALIDVPIEEVALVAPCEQVLVRAGDTEWNLALRV